MDTHVERGLSLTGVDGLVAYQFSIFVRSYWECKGCSQDHGPRRSSRTCRRGRSGWRSRPEGWPQSAPPPYTPTTPTTALEPSYFGVFEVPFVFNSKVLHWLDRCLSVILTRHSLYGGMKCLYGLRVKKWDYIVNVPAWWRKVGVVPIRQHWIPRCITKAIGAKFCVQNVDSG